LKKNSGKRKKGQRGGSQGVLPLYNIGGKKEEGITLHHRKGERKALYTRGV